MNKINKRLENIENDIVRINNSRDEHFLLFDHIYGLIAWTLFIIFIVGVFIPDMISYLNQTEKEIEPESYYSNADTFCQYYNMTYEHSFIGSDSCINSTNDVYQYKYIYYKNERYYFLDEK